MQNLKSYSRNSRRRCARMFASTLDARQPPGQTKVPALMHGSAHIRALTHAHALTRNYSQTHNDFCPTGRARGHGVCAQCPRRQKQAHTLDSGARICPTASQYKTTTTNMLPLLRLRRHPPPLLLAAPPPRPSPSTTPPGQSPPDSRPNRTPCSTWSGTSRPVSSVACPASETSR